MAQMQLVDHDTFLRQLEQLFEKRKAKGSVWLTHKRLLNDGPDSTMHDQGDVEYPCLLRVTDGSGIKFSTKVNSSDLSKFHVAYGALLKTSMSTLRKRDKKREKQNAEESAKRKAKATEPVKIEGQKRGAGRRKRQRQLKALLKQQESQKKFHEREEARKRAEVVI